jgi:hypothetical protein
MQYPLEFAKTRVQLRAEKGVPTPRNPFLVVTQVYHKEGLRALYKGCGPLVLVSRNCSLAALNFIILRTHSLQKLDIRSKHSLCADM